MFLGIDVGAAATKVVIIDDGSQIVSHSVCPSGMDFREAGQKAVREALATHSLEQGDIARAVASGYGRKNVSSVDATKTEIACHAKGVFHYFQELFGRV